MNIFTMVTMLKNSFKVNMEILLIFLLSSDVQPKYKKNEM